MRVPHQTKSKILATCGHSVAPLPIAMRMPPYVIFSDKTLRELARLRPSTRYELRGVYGIGDPKLEAFGDAVLRVVSESGGDAAAAL